jgi:RNA polymerase sigma-70 factor (ECF subfamily)
MGWKPMPQLGAALPAIRGWDALDTLGGFSSFFQFLSIFCKFLSSRRSNIVAMAEMIDDELLVEQFSRGDESAFERIVEQYSAEVAVLANRLLGWPGEVEDVTQEIFLAAFMGLKKFRCECSLKSWLFTITINKCRSHRHKWKLRQLRTIPILMNGIGMRLPRADTGVSSMDEEDFNHVRRAVAGLPARYREPVVLKYLQELDIDEISQILGISKNTLYVRLSRARKLLEPELAGLIERL